MSLVIQQFPISFVVVLLHVTKPGTFVNLLERPGYFMLSQMEGHRTEMRLKGVAV